MNKEFLAKLKKIKKLDPDGKAYLDAAYNLALCYCPEIRPCKKCTHPVVDGYCCGTCGTANPYWTVEQEDAFERKSAERRNT